MLCACRGSATYRPEHLGWAAPTAARPLLVVDIDDTVATTPGGSLYALLPVWPKPPAPLPGAPEVLTRLAASHRLVFLTARWSLLAPGTLRWLDRCGFPEAPVIFSRRPLLGASAQQAYKTAALRRLQATGHDIRWAVGDKVSDILAYRAVGAEALLLAEGPLDEDAVLLGRCVPDVPAACLLLRPCTAWRDVETVLSEGQGGR